MKYSNLIWIAVGLLLVGGVALTVRDYRDWRGLETARYGQGSEAEIGLVPAMELSLPYPSATGGFRIKYPLGWKATENPVYVPKTSKPIVLPSQNLAELLRFEDPNSMARIKVLAQTTTSDDLAGWATRLGEGITRDQEYITVGKVPFTILTWDTPDETVQKAMAIVNNKLIVIEATSETSAWKTWAKTFGKVYQSWTKI